MISPGNVFRQQLPVYSPLSVRALASSAARQLHDARGAVAELEALLVARYDAKRAILTGSGTQALLLGLRSAMVAAGSARVALPGFSCYDVAAAAVGAGATIGLYDLDPATLGPALDSLERELAAGVRVVVVSPLYGIPVDWDAVAGLCARYGAILLEDAAQGHGASWRSRPLGSLGDISVVSFGRGKGWSGGAGGAALYRSVPPPPAAWLGESSGGSAKTLTRAALQWALGRPGTYGLPASIPWLGLGETHYHDVADAEGAPPLSAPLVLANRAAADLEAAVRRGNAGTLIEAARGSLATPITGPHGGEPGFLRLPLRIQGDRERFTERRARRLGIMPSYPAPLATLPAVRPRLHSTVATWPGAEELAHALFTAPTHSRLTPDDIRSIAAFFPSDGRVRTQKQARYVNA